MNYTNRKLPRPQRPNDTNVARTEPNSHALDSQRSTAQQIVRQQIDRVYEQEPPNQLNDPYNKTYNQTPQQANWDQYHTAWQKYYQQYYHRYYMQQLHLQRQKSFQDKAEAAARTTNDEIKDDVKNTTYIKDRLLDKVRQRAKKFRHSNHFLPIVSTLVVILLFIFLQYNRLFFAEVKAYVSPGSTINSSETILVDPLSNANVGSDPKLIIPKINVNIKVVYDVKSLKEDDIQEGLKRGVVHYNLPKANSLPGEVGNTVILGHSSNDIFDPGDYKFAFVLLDKLDAGDVFYLHYEGKRYIYKVSSKKIIDPKQISELQIAADKPIVTLVTCTPPGTALKRLLVRAEQVSPDPNKAKPSDTSNDSSRPEELPGNSPTFFDKVYDFFF